MPEKADTKVSATSISLPLGLIVPSSPVNKDAAAVVKSLGTIWVPSASTSILNGVAVGATAFKACSIPL